jgi:hypothetical protein
MAKHATPDPKPELLSGTCTQMLFSPQGDIEGLLFTVKGHTVQLSMGPKDGAQLARHFSPGKRLHLLAVTDLSPKTAQGVHPVYLLDSLADAAGKPVAWPDTEPSSQTVAGVVASLHYARHGQPNGVMLATGEFIHLKPPGMMQFGLKPGAQVTATGVLRMTVLNTPLLEADQVNGVALA